jgi:L,D-transpeptidase YcbB
MAAPAHVLVGPRQHQSSFADYLRRRRHRDIATGEREDIVLPKKLPVARIYLTAWMTRDQTVQFRNDIYDQDEQLLEATAEEAAFFNQAANYPLTAHLAQ